MEEIKRIADDLRAELASIPQERRKRPLNSSDEMFAKNIEHLLASQRAISREAAIRLLNECLLRITAGRVLTGIHREYITAVINKLLDPNIGSVREVTTLAKTRGKAKRDIRNLAKLRFDLKHVEAGDLIFVLKERIQGRLRCFPKKVRVEAIAKEQKRLEGLSERERNEAIRGARKRRESIPPCERAEAIHWLAQKVFFKTERYVAKRISEAEKAYDIVRPRGRPIKRSKK